MLIPFAGRIPAVSANAFVEESARIIGDVMIGDFSSVWFHTVIRGDVRDIRIGCRSNIQDNSTIHVTTDQWSTHIGDDVTVGHGVILHGCAVGDRCLVGMGAVLLDGVVIEADCLIGAGSLVTPGTRVPAGHLVLGNPARVVRPLRDDERNQILASGQSYVALARRYQSSTGHP